MTVLKHVSKSFPNTSLWLQDETGSLITDLASCTIRIHKKKGSSLEYQPVTVTFIPYQDFKPNFNTLYFIKLPGQAYACVSFELDPFTNYKDNISYEVDGKTSVWYEDFSIYETDLEGFKVKSALYNLKDKLILNLESDSSNPSDNCFLKVKTRKVDNKSTRYGFNLNLDVSKTSFKYNRFL